jgi:hypothetical protein
VNAWKKAKEAELGQENVPIVLCGDFNSTPDSSIYALLTSSQTKHADEKKEEAAQEDRGTHSTPIDAVVRFLITSLFFLNNNTYYHHQNIYINSLSRIYTTFGIIY